MGLFSGVKGGVDNTIRDHSCGVVGVNFGMVDEERNVYRGKIRVGGGGRYPSLLFPLRHEVIGYKEEERSMKLLSEVHTMYQCPPHDYRK
jgi:hypothetical protein